MRKKELIWISIFALFLLGFALFSIRTEFHDAAEYITIAKNFAGINNMDLFCGHSLLYPLIISIFLKMSPSMTMIKIVNIFWIFLMATVLLFWVKDKKAFILFAFSPIVWFMSIQITPILPASFFFLLAFLFFYKKNLKFHNFYSGIFLGFSCALYTPLFILGFFFLLIYFWNQKFSNSILYLFAMFLGFLPRMIQDYYLFKMPVYSMIREVGADFIIAIGGNPSATTINLLSNLEILIIIILISPFLFRIHRVDFSKYKQPLIFLGIIFAILLLRVQTVTYFLILTPVTLIILGKYLTEKEIKWHCYISVIIIIFMTWNFFLISEEYLIQKDLEKITQEFEAEYILSGPHEAVGLSAVWWESFPKFIWWQDYEASINNQTTIRSYNIGINPKINLRSNLEIIANFNRGNNKTYEDYILVTWSDFEELKDFNLIKCYDVLCVYERYD